MSLSYSSAKSMFVGSSNSLTEISYFIWNFKTGGDQLRTKLKTCCNETRFFWGGTS